MDEFPTIKGYLRSDCLLFEDYIRSTIPNRYLSCDFEWPDYPRASVREIEGDKVIYCCDSPYEALYISEELNRGEVEYCTLIFKYVNNFK